MTNYASGHYNDKNGPATYAALTGPLAEQFIRYVHSEAVGTSGIWMPDKPLAAARRRHVDGIVKHLRHTQAQAWCKISKTHLGP